MGATQVASECQLRRVNGGSQERELAFRSQLTTQLTPIRMGVKLWLNGCQDGYARPLASIMPGRTLRDTGHKGLCPVSGVEAGSMGRL